MFAGYRNGNIHEYSVPSQTSTKKEISLKTEWKITTKPEEMETITSLKLIHNVNTKEEEKEEESKVRVVIGTNSGKVFIYSLLRPTNQSSLVGTVQQKNAMETIDLVSNVVVSGFICYFTSFIYLSTGSPIVYVATSKTMEYVYAFNKHARQFFVWELNEEVKGRKPIKMESEVAVAEDKRILVANGSVLTLKDCIVCEFEFLFFMYI